MKNIYEKGVESKEFKEIILNWFINEKCQLIEVKNENDLIITKINSEIVTVKTISWEEIVSLLKSYLLDGMELEIITESETLFFVDIKGNVNLFDWIKLLVKSDFEEKEIVELTTSLFDPLIANAIDTRDTVNKLAVDYLFEGYSSTTISFSDELLKKIIIRKYNLNNKNIELLSNSEGLLVIGIDN